MSKVCMKLSELPIDPGEIQIEVSYGIDGTDSIYIDGIRMGSHYHMREFFMREISPDYHKANFALEQAVIQHLKAEGELVNAEVEGDRRAANEFYARKAG